MKKLLIAAMLVPWFAWGQCTVVQVSPSHRDVSCTGNVAVRNPQPKTITTYTMVPYETQEEDNAYYPTRVTGTVAGGQYVPPRQTYGWSSGSSGRNTQGGQR